jgi:peroxiredoxin
LPDITAAGASLVAVSPEQPPHARETKGKGGLAFEVLSDHGNGLARRFGLVFQFPPDLMELYRAGFKNDLPSRHGTAAWELPIPATYVIERTGIIRLAFVDPDYTRRLEPEEIVRTLRTLG